MEIKNIAVWGLAIYDWLTIPFIREFKSRHGAKIHFICSNEQSVKYWKRLDADGVIDSFVKTNHFFFEYDNCTGSFEEIASQARYYEEKYGVYVVDVLQTDRHLGRGFSAAGGGHPRSELSNKASYIKSVNMFNKIFKYWEEYFNNTKPDLLIGTPAGIIGKICMCVARYYNVPIRVLKSARYKALFYWVVNEYQTRPDLERVYRSIADVDKFVDDRNLEGSIELSVVAGEYRRFMERRSIVWLLKATFKQIKSYAYRRLNRVVSMGNYRLSEDLKYLYRCYRCMNAIMKFRTFDTKALPKIPYVFFPLHLEPETALGVFSPEFNEQLALIEFIAKNLPAGVILAVKEHLLAVGKRPVDFYTTLLDIPNVVMIHPNEHALSVAKNARCVIVITGTLGTEALMLGVPVISFGMHNNFDFLPHAHTVKSWTELRPLLLSILSREDTKEAREKRAEDGKRYLAAIKSISIDLAHESFQKERDSLDTSKRKAEILYSSLMKSLNSKKITSLHKEYHEDKVSAPER